VRILTVGNLYPPHHFGGYEQVWGSAVGYLRERGHEVRVLATRFRHTGVPDGDEPDLFRELRWYWRDHEFERFALRERVRIERHNHAVLARHLDELTPDVVAFWSMGGMSHSLIESVRRLGIPSVAFVHDQWLDYGRFTDQWLRLFYDRRWLPARLAEQLIGVPAYVNYAIAARYVFVSEFVRRRALALSLGLRDTTVAHSGIASSFLCSGSGRVWGWRLLYVGRLHPDKGIHDAVSALTLLPDEATLTFAGSWDPREEAGLSDAVNQLGLRDRVTLLGQLPADKIGELYRSSDVLLFPVRWDEPWGLVPLEAMGSGCPVIATGRGGSGEYLRDGENCLLVPAEAPDHLAAAVGRLAASDELRQRLRCGGIRSAPQYTETIFNEAVEGHLIEMAERSSTLPQSSPG